MQILDYVNCLLEIYSEHGNLEVQTYYHTGTRVDEFPLIMHHSDRDAIGYMETHYYESIAAKHRSIDEQVRATYASHRSNRKLARWIILVAWLATLAMFVSSKV